MECVALAQSAGSQMDATTLDRTLNEQFPITQDFLASLLGCTRPTLNGILVDLEKSGALQNRRGAIAIVNGPLLHESACECYEIIRQTYEVLVRRADSLMV